MAKIDKNKYDTSEVEYGFNRCIRSGQLFVEPDSVDKIFDTMIAMAKGSSVSGKQDLDKTTKNAQTRNNEAAETVKTKAKSQGFISKALDKISGLWGGINQDDVEKIISEHDKELQELESLKNDPKAYAAKFKEIFGINYSKDAVENYNQINTQYKRTLLLTQQQQIFDSTFKEELETPNPGKITDEQYRKTYQKLSDMLGENVINTFLEQAGVEGKSTTEKYKILTNNMDKAEGAAGQTAEVKPQEETSPESHAANTETNNDTRIPAEKATQAENTKATDETQTAKEIKTSEEEFKISDELAEKYPDVANTNFYGGAETEKKTIELLENYENLVKNQKMDYENFDPSVIYRLISDHGIADNDMDRVFNIIKNRFHKDVIAEENRISGLKNQYKFSSEESITQSDNIINTIKEKQANGEKISIDDIEDMILDNLADQRDFEKIKKRIMEDPEIKNYINDNTHADILGNPEYTDIYSERELKQATKILDDILAKVRGGEEFNKELIDNYEASGMVKEALEKMLANHWELGPKFKEIS